MAARPWRRQPGSGRLYRASDSGARVRGGLRLGPGPRPLELVHESARIRTQAVHGRLSESHWQDSRLKFHGPRRFCHPCHGLGESVKRSDDSELVPV
jgi:hypothetical protein